MPNVKKHGFYSYYRPVGVTLSADGAATVHTTL